MSHITGVVLLALLAVCSATNGNGIIYPFPIDSLLVCHIKNPFDIPGLPLSVPEPTPTLSLAPNNVNNGRPIWLPQEGGFNMPPNKYPVQLNNQLREFLGGDFNPLLTSVDPPTSLPAKACELLPAIEGSAGQQLRYFEQVDEPINLLDQRADDDRASPNSLVHNQTVADPTRDFMTADGYNEFLLGQNFEIISNGIAREINSRPQLEDVWVARCVVTPQWRLLPRSFFPRYLAQSTCSGFNCSLPHGLRCLEDFTHHAFVTMLRWDCCFNNENLETRWDCGWKRVRVPIFCDCTCGCNESG